MFPRLIASVLAGEAGRMVGRIKAAAIAYLLAGVLVLVGAGFLVGALYIYLRTLNGPLIATLIMAGGFIGAALVVLLIHMFISSSRARRRKRRRRDDMTGVAAASLLALAPALLRARSPATLIGLPLAALIASHIYRENFGRRARRPDDEDGDD